MTAPAASPTASRPGTLLLVGVLGFGHFPVYANNLTLWALSRGIGVVYAGLCQPDNFYVRKFADHPGVCFCPLAGLGFAEFSGRAETDANLALRLFGERWREILDAAFARFSPSHAVLLNADHLFFERDEICSGQPSPPGPVWGVCTFGHREVHTGLVEPYARRLNLLLHVRRGLRGVLSIDEDHVRARDPGEEYLHLLPDPYCEFGLSSPENLPDEQRRDLDALRGFLDADERFVLPVLGKFDRRKNNLWIAQAVDRTPGLRLAVLGQRVPDPEGDPGIDALLDRLQRQGRLFLRFGYVPELLFRAILASPRVRCLPLPYRNHYGSSGIQIMGAEYGLPVLVPEIGLMAQRVTRHGLGRLFAVGDPRSFEEQLGLLVREGREPYAGHCARFIANFGPEAVGTALDRALLGLDLPASPLLASGPGADSSGEEDPVAVALADDRPELALAHLERRAAAQPRREGSAGLALLRGVLRWRTGAWAEAGEDFRLCLSAGLREELAFLSSLVADAARDAAAGDAAQALARAETWLAALLSCPEATTRPSGAEVVRCIAQRPDASFLGASFWERLGGMYVRAKRLDAGEACFRRAMELAREDLDLYLTLSDVLRYQGRNEDSLAVLDALEARAPGHPGLSHKRGQVMLQLGRVREAAALFRSEPEDSPHREAAQRLLRGMRAG